MSILNLYEKQAYKMRLFKRFKWWYRRWKFKWQRALWGFSDYDVWDLDVYLAELIGDALLYRAKNSYSHFYDMTAEETQQWFIDTAQMFKDWNRELPEPAYEAYKASIKREQFDGGVTISGDDDLAEAMKNFEKFNLKYLPVCDKNGLFHGFVSKAAIFVKYRRMVREADEF